MKKALILLITSIAVGALLYTSCSKDDEEVLEELIAIEVTPADVYFEPGVTQQYTAIGVFADSTTSDITAKVTWRSSNEDVATVSESGLATGVAQGHTFISASNGLMLGSALANVLAGADLERTQMIQDYNDNYLGSENPDCGWTGNADVCDPGTITSVSYDKVIQRVNYFRRLCGLHDNITLKTEYNDKCQVAALMFKANETIDHYPPPTWECFDSDGEEAAGKSNIAYGFHTSAAVTAYIDDFGAGNERVGHRRWILYSKANAMGEGSTDNTEALWVQDYLSSAPSGTPDYWPYPMEGYFPAPLVFDRWSLIMPDATFTNAQVEMTDQAGDPVSLDIIFAYEGGPYAGDPAIVWEPDNINTNGPDDVTYTVTVSGITGGSQSSVTYDVIIVQPTSTKRMTEYERIRMENPDARVIPLK